MSAPVGTTIELRFIAPAKVVSSNVEGNWHYAVRSKWRKAWHDGLAPVWAEHAELLATVKGAYLFAQWWFPVPRWLDHANLAACAKAATDSLVQSGLVLEDDAPKYFDGEHTKCWKPKQPGLCVLRLTVVEPVTPSE